MHELNEGNNPIIKDRNGYNTVTKDFKPRTLCTPSIGRKRSKAKNQMIPKAAARITRVAESKTRSNAIYKLL